MKILIPTMVGDDHARIVCCAATRRGIDVHRWFTADYPCRQSISIYYENAEETNWVFNGPSLSLENQKFDVIWLRRPVPPILPDILHPEDRQVAVTENAFFFRSLWHALAKEAFWINSYPGHLAARSKLLQLREAKQSGFTIPRTLVSNDPDDIAAFILKNQPNQTIYKSFFPARWDLSDGNAAVLETTKISVESLPNPEILRLTPGIFQPYIEKEFEVRATFLGAHVVAIRLNSQHSQQGKTDYRVSPINELDPEPYILPPEIYESCRQLMKKLNIVFGCFDFIVTPEHDFVFLEVNEMGQFLWKEQVCPETRILDAFLDFLMHPSFDFEWQPRADRIRLSSIIESDEYNRLELEENTLHMRSFPNPTSGFYEAR
ncbi:MvdC/MvdD family ATP grasp protein [Nitrosomonas sp.]|uniref:MvdC/MvdD family ATP grasp protein n=1 Tax=Nitrosomonas sp. TaxID=42353 RepID=UPI0026259D4A|nr:hypothetical protein [Nitrosomonas sp.]